MPPECGGLYGSSPSPSPSPSVSVSLSLQASPEYPISSGRTAKEESAESGEVDHFFICSSVWPRLHKID